MQCYEKGNIRQVAAKYGNTLLYSASQRGTVLRVVVGMFSFFKNSQSNSRGVLFTRTAFSFINYFRVFFLIKHQISNFTILR